MSLSDLELAKEAIKTLAKFRNSNDPAAEELVSLFYTADKKLPELITKLDSLISAGTRDAKQEAGYLLESIAIVAFSSLNSWSDLKSYQSAGPQHDLLIEGSDSLWQQLCWHFYMPENRRAILLEAKATGSRLSDPQFARMCAILDHNLAHAGLGIFLTLKGASGFPSVRGSSLRSLTACRLRQVVYHAKTGRPIIVFDEGDIRQLCSNGALPILIHRKVKEIFELTGLPTAPVADFRQVLLPPHLASLVNNLSVTKNISSTNKRKKKARRPTS